MLASDEFVKLENDQLAGHSLQMLIQQSPPLRAALKSILLAFSQRIAQLCPPQEVHGPVTRLSKA